MDLNASIINWLFYSDLFGAFLVSSWPNFDTFRERLRERKVMKLRIAALDAVTLKIPTKFLERF